MSSESNSETMGDKHPAESAPGRRVPLTPRIGAASDREVILVPLAGLALAALVFWWASSHYRLSMLISAGIAGLAVCCWLMAWAATLVRRLRRLRTSLSKQ